MIQDFENYPNTAKHLRLGQISFDDALSLQEEAIFRFRESGDGLPVIFSLEHKPVITCGRSTELSNLLLSSDEYKKRGVDVRTIDRGGDVTFHGPGQVVVYPIISLRKHNLRPGEYIRILEEAMIRTCAKFGVEAYRKERFPGCWTDKGKVGAIGTAVKSGGITKHGLALNVDTDLDYCDMIIPCGISDKDVVRLSDLTNAEINCEIVELEVVKNIAELLKIDLELS